MGFEPLSEASLRALSLTTLFLVVLTAATRFREFKALSSVLPFVEFDACLMYVPQFGAQSESLTHSIPRSFLVESLSDFAEGLNDDLLLCSARALRISLNWSRLSIPFASLPLSHRVLGGGIHPLCEVNLAPSHPEVGSVGAHGIHGGSTYIALHRTWSVSVVLASATWGSGSVISCFYLRDIPHVFHCDRFLCLFVLCMSQPKMSRGVVLLVTYRAECPGCLRVPSSHFQDSVDSSDWWLRQPVPEASSDRHGVAVALSSSL